MICNILPALVYQSIIVMGKNVYNYKDKFYMSLLVQIVLKQNNLFGYFGLNVLCTIKSCSLIVVLIRLLLFISVRQSVCMG
jgi:hypothetical protein